MSGPQDVSRPLTRDQLRELVRPIVADYVAGLRVKRASILERVEFLEEQRAAEVARLRGGGE